MELTLKSIRNIFQRSTKTKQKDTSNTSHIADAIHNNDSINQLNAKNIENTPFQMVGNDHKGYFIALGDYRLTPIFKTQHLTTIYLNKHHWEVIAAMTATIVEQYNKLNNQLQNGK